MDVIPAIDLQSGKCVRLLKGKKNRATEYSSHPVDMARHWVDEGARRLHLVDLDGAFEEQTENKTVIREILDAVPVPCQIGGGLRNLDSVGEILEAGADAAIIGTAGIKDPDLLGNLVDEFGADRIYAGVDCRDETVLVRGWEEQSQYRRDEWITRLESLGVKTVIYTNVDRDGTEEGPDYAGTRDVLESSDLNVIASGGIGSLEHLRSLGENAHPRLTGVIVGRALYEERFTLPEAQDVLGESINS